MDYDDRVIYGLCWQSAIRRSIHFWDLVGLGYLRNFSKESAILLIAMIQIDEQIILKKFLQSMSTNEGINSWIARMIK